MQKLPHHAIVIIVFTIISSLLAFLVYRNWSMDAAVIINEIPVFQK